MFIIFIHTVTENVFLQKFGAKDEIGVDDPKNAVADLRQKYLVLIC